MDTESCLANNLPTSFVSVDFEYIPQKKDESCKGKQYKAVWSIGMVKYIEGQICDKYYSLVCPPQECLQSSNLVQLKKLNPELNIDEFIDKLKSENKFNELFPAIENFIDGFPLVAYNSATERKCFEALVRRYILSTKIDYSRIHDPKILSQKVECALKHNDKGEGYGLVNVCKRNGVEVLQNHNALDDAIMCGNLFLEMSQLARQNCLNVTAFAEPKTLNGQIAEKIKQQKYDKKDLIPNKNIDSIKENEFKNKYIALTGIPYDLTSQYASRLNNCGAHIVDKVTKKTNILIVGTKPGPKKKEDAEKNGVEIMSEFEMLEILNHFEDGM